MKLRNKKTGEVIDAECRTTLKGNFWIIRLNPWGKPIHMNFYESLAELNAEWEDYESKEPLIKDEKICKAVRAWAEANDLLTFKVVNKHFDCFEVIGYGDHNISSRIGFKSTIAHTNKNQFYTIDELCGEEDE